MRRRREKLALALLVARVLADDAANALAHDHTAVFATGADGWADFHRKGDLRGGGRRRVGDGAGSRDDIAGTEPIDDATFTEVVRSHLQFYTIAREDAYFMNAHASGEVTKKFVVGGLLRRHTNAERGIGIRFFDHAYEFNDVFRQRKNAGKNEQESR
jgi:hypothetical protein